MGCQASTAVTTVDVAAVVPETETPTGAESHSPIKAPSDFHAKYSLEVMLGQGSFSRVYSCKQVCARPEEELAVKITDLQAKGASRKESAEVERRAEREATVLRRIAGQSHVCSMVDCLTDGHFHYIVMEKGSSSLFDMLSHMLELTEQSLARVVRQMLLGVAGVHALGLVHFDVKPDNFMCFGKEGTVKLCDFGLAETISGSSSSPLCNKGTAPFMSPEIISGKGVGAPTDVWSLGVSVYTMLVGQFPYMPSKRDKELIKATIAAGVPEPTYQPVGAEVSLSLPAQSLLRDLLCRDAAVRPTAAKALEHCWFALGAEWKPQSLKAVLRCAKKAGACSPGGRPRMDAVDEMLCDLQEKAGPLREAAQRDAKGAAGMRRILALEI